MFYLWTGLQWRFPCCHCSSGQLNVIDYSVCLHVLIYDQKAVESFPCVPLLRHLQAFPTAVGLPRGATGNQHVNLSCFDAPSMPL